MEDKNQINDNTVEVDHGQTYFAWSFPEFNQHERSKRWYIWAGVAILFLLIFSIYTADYLFAIIVIISSLIILLFQRSSNRVEFKITEDGVIVNNNFFDYQELKNFYIIYQPPEIKSLYFESKSILRPRIPVSLEDQNPVKIREVLLKHLEEDLEKEKEPISEQFSRMFKL